VKQQVEQQRHTTTRVYTVATDINAYRRCIIFGQSRIWWQKMAEAEGLAEE